MPIHGCICSVCNKWHSHVIPYKNKWRCITCKRIMLKNKEIIENKNLVKLSNLDIKEKVLTNLNKDLSTFEDSEGHLIRKNYSEPYWVGYVKCLKDSIRLVKEA